MPAVLLEMVAVTARVVFSFCWWLISWVRADERVLGAALLRTCTLNQPPVPCQMNTKAPQHGGPSCVPLFPSLGAAAQVGGSYGAGNYGMCAYSQALVEWCLMSSQAFGCVLGLQVMATARLHAAELEVERRCALCVPLGSRSAGGRAYSPNFLFSW